MKRAWITAWFACVVACTGSAPRSPSTPGGTADGSGGSGSGGTGGSVGSGGTGGSVGSGGDTDPGSGGTDPGNGDTGSGDTGSGDAGTGGATTQSLSCAGYVSCVLAAMSEQAYDVCDDSVSDTAGTLLDAVYDCIEGYCSGTSGAKARCKFAEDGTPQNTDGTAAFDDEGSPTGDCGVCLINGEAPLYGDSCQPATDAACQACTTTVNACLADK